MSRELYRIEEIGGRKVIHYHGFIDTDNGIGWRITEATFCGLGGQGTEIAYVDAIGPDKAGFIAEQLEACHQYVQDVDLEQAKAYFQGWGGKPLHINRVNADTPVGAYWYTAR